jgi:hypothetical protein
MRELSYSAIRMGLYDEVKELLAGEAASTGARNMSFIAMHIAMHHRLKPSTV